VHFGDVGYNGELELISVSPKEFLKVHSLRFRPDGSSDGVAFLEEGADDMDGGETVRASDENIAPWGDDRHILL
jgi:hypothetical protein